MQQQRYFIKAPKTQKLKSTTSIQQEIVNELSVARYINVFQRNFFTPYKLHSASIMFLLSYLTFLLWLGASEMEKDSVFQYKLLLML